MKNPDSPQFPDSTEEFDELFAQISESNGFSVLQNSARDPYIERAHDEVRRYNEVLAHEGEVSMDEAASIEHELDGYWQGLIRQKISVTGSVHIESDDIESDHVVSDAKMASRGFSVRGDVVTNDAGEAIVKNPKVQHAFKVGRGTLDATLEGKAARRKVWAYADVDSVQIEPESISTERAAAWLESHYPELFEEINDRVFNSEGDEGESLLSLKGLDLVKYAPIDDDVTREYVLAYIQDIVDIDHLIFYSLGVEGPYEVKYKNSETTEELDALLKKGVLAYAYGPYIDCEIAEGTPDRWSIIGEFAIATPKKNESTVVIRASLESVKSLMSIRHAYYGS